MDILSVILLIVCAILIAGTIFMYRILSKSLDRIDFFEKWTEEFLQRAYSAYEELKRIDNSGAFEADDEVGYFFKSLKEIMNRIFEMGVIDEEEIEAQRKEAQDKISGEEINKTLAENKKARSSAKIQR